ncbi:MAG: cohesin domain-containing protein [Bacteroidales bacterium]
MEIKIYSKWLTTVSAFLILSIEIFSQAPPVTSIGTVSLAAGTYSVPVLVTGFNNVGNISLSLNYNPAELVFTGVTLNSGLSQAPGFITPTTDQSGLFRFSYVSATAVILAPPGSTLLTLTFTAKPGVQSVHSLLTWSSLQGACDITPPSPGSFNPKITVANMATYFLDGFVDIGPFGKTLNLTGYLEGLYSSGGLMNKARGNTGDQFPGTTADLITIELHSATAGQYSTILYTALNVNLSTTGLASATIPSNLAGSYYVTVKHRNSIETVSAIALSFAGSVISHNFTTSAAMAFGGRLKNIGSIYAIYAGDVNQDDLIDISDMIIVDNLSAVATTGYLPSDVNGDALIDITDMIIIDNNSRLAIGASTPN